MTKPKLLIVDDDPGIRTQLKWGLDDYEVITADSREMAIEQFELHLPTVVTLDLGLPPDIEGTSEGYATLGAILQKSPKTKVVVVSASNQEVNSQLAIVNGAFQFYPKPIDLSALKAILEAAYIESQNTH